MLIILLLLLCTATATYCNANDAAIMLIVAMITRLKQLNFSFAHMQINRNALMDITTVTHISSIESINNEEELNDMMVRREQKVQIERMTTVLGIDSFCDTFSEGASKYTEEMQLVAFLRE